MLRKVLSRAENRGLPTDSSRGVPQQDLIERRRDFDSITRDEIGKEEFEESGSEDQCRNYIYSLFTLCHSVVTGTDKGHNEI
jgi:hypothetical protein